MFEMRNLTHAVAALLATAFIASPGLAQTKPAQDKTTLASLSTTKSNELLQDLGSAERIQHSGALRMLSQRISASICNRAAGIKTEDADKYLKRAARDYSRILAGLVHGDDGLGLYGAESDPVVLREVGRLNAIWKSLDRTVNDTPADDLTRDHAVVVSQTAPEMLGVSEHLVGVVAAEYSDPSQMLQAEAVLLQIAERQRMLEQEIANATCMIAEDIDVTAAKEKLSNAIPLYEVSLKALQDGRPELGIAKAPNQTIALWLGDIEDRFNKIRPLLDKIIETGEVSKQEQTVVYEEMNKLTWMMNVTAGQYTEVSKLKF